MSTDDYDRDVTITLGIGQYWKWILLILDGIGCTSRISVPFVILSIERMSTENGNRTFVCPHAEKPIFFTNENVVIIETVGPQLVHYVGCPTLPLVNIVFQSLSYHTPLFSGHWFKLIEFCMLNTIEHILYHWYYLMIHKR